MITTTHRILSGLAAASLLLSAVPAIAEDDSSASSSSQASVHPRCIRFRGGDLERCERILRRMGVDTSASVTTETSSSASSSGADATSDEWKWTNIFNRLEEKVGSAVKYVSVLAKKFCRERSEEGSVTSRECMARIKVELQARVTKLIDVAFRADLPSSR